jgi:hypothetical protein
VPSRHVAAGVLGLALVAFVVGVLVGGHDESPRPPAASVTPTPTPTPTATSTPTATPTPVPLDAPTRGPSLAVGITEPNTNLVAPPPNVALPPVWAHWRDELARIRPAVYRIFIPWSGMQPRPAARPNLAVPNAGCSRDKGPCAPFTVPQDQFRALAWRHWTGMLVFSGMPPWAAADTQGCRRGSGPGAAGPRVAALPAFRRMIADVLALARAEGADIRYVTPWNEPNHPFSLAPQRAVCDPGAPSLATRAYARLARAAKAALPDGVELVLGEVSGVLDPKAGRTSVPEMIRGLPRDVVCGARVWSVHAYIGGADPAPATAAALDARHCPRRHAIWITETGVGAAGPLAIAHEITGEHQGCRLLHRRLVDWYRNRRVTLAVQYTFREDDFFPTGLVTSDLGRAKPELREWQAWGDRPSLSAPPPRPHC